MFLEKKKPKYVYKEGMVYMNGLKLFAAEESPDLNRLLSDANKYYMLLDWYKFVNKWYKPFIETLNNEIKEIISN